MAKGSILTIPPFPGARPPRFAEPDRAAAAAAAGSEEMLAALAKHRVGGCYWGRQRELPATSFVLDGTGSSATGAVVWDRSDDPWHLLAHADFARLREDDPRALLVLAAKVPLLLVCADGSVRDAEAYDAVRWTKALVSGWRYRNPFDGSPLSALQAIELCGFWRQIIDSNRHIHSVLGMAYWKKPTVTPLLWAGEKVPYNRQIDHVLEDRAVAIWRSRLTTAQQSKIDKSLLPMIEIEDGFIRSQGLGADCVPPLSIIVDALGPHFAPGAASEIERILQDGHFAPELLARAQRLRETIVARGLSKYEAGATVKLTRPGGSRLHILVPGQVEDDRAVTSGGALASNLELLRRARAAAGHDAYLIYKPHPDVLAGHRRGHISESEMASLADQIETTSPMPALIEMVDELYVNSSLAGFEALLRGKKVTVFGVPFYAGWGLTNDLGSVPARRTRHRTIDELVAAALLLYPRYLDPVTGLPCPPEVVVARLSERGAARLDLRQSAIVGGRRLLGRARTLLNRG